jgi:hypothetical protein
MAKNLGGDMNTDNASAEPLRLFPPDDPPGPALAPQPLLHAQVRRQLTEQVRSQVAAAAIGPLAGVTCFVAAGPFTALAHPLGPLSHPVSAVGVRIDDHANTIDITLDKDWRPPADHIDPATPATQLGQLLVALATSTARWSTSITAPTWRRLRRQAHLRLGSPDSPLPTHGQAWDFPAAHLPGLDPVRIELIEATTPWSNGQHGYLVITDPTGRHGLCVARRRRHRPTLRPDRPAQAPVP